MQLRIFPFPLFSKKTQAVFLFGWKFGNPQANRIVSKLERTLSENLDEGIPLKGEFKGLFKLRIGDYRVIYTKTKKGVIILKIGHRSTV